MLVPGMCVTYTQQPSLFRVMNRILLTFVFIFFLAACDQTDPLDSPGPSSTDTSSTAFTTLSDRVTFLEKYMLFRRNYQALDFVIHYRNNGYGWGAGPSEWDIRIVAVVPADELALWTTGLEPVSPDDTSWLVEVPTKIDYSGVRQWYAKHSDITHGVLTGIDTEKSVVVYRSLHQ